jgi:hypothetical protein
MSQQRYREAPSHSSRSSSAPSYSRSYGQKRDYSYATTYQLTETNRIQEVVWTPIASVEQKATEAEKVCATTYQLTETNRIQEVVRTPVAPVEQKATEAEKVCVCEQEQDGRQPERQSSALTGLLREIIDYPAELRAILQPVFESNERRVQVEVKLGEIRSDKAIRTEIAGKFLDALTFDIAGTGKDDGPLGKLANPVPVPFQANLWNTAFKLGQDGSEGTEESDGSSGDGPLGKLANPVPVPFQANLWNTAFKLGQDGSKGTEESDGSSGDGPSVALSTQTVTNSAAGPSQELPFMQWTRFREHPLASTSDFVEAYHEAILATYENLNVEISVGSNIASVSLSGFVRKIRDWLHRRDLLAIWRSTPRTVLLPEEYGPNVDNRRLDALDKELFDTAKFAQFDTRLTTLTYGDGPYGSITLFRTESSNTRAPHGAQIVRPIAAMEHVPKAILVKMNDNVLPSSKTALRVKKQKVEWLSCEEKDRPVYAMLENNGEKIGQGYGHGLMKSLSIDPSGKSADGILATIQQMLALWHIKSSILCNVKSTNVRIIRDPAAIGYVTFAPGQVWRGVRILKGPDQMGHETGNPRVVVLHPLSGGWLNEKLFWS